MVSLSGRHLRKDGTTQSETRVETLLEALAKKAEKS
jgi:hypothetical protein